MRRTLSRLTAAAAALMLLCCAVRPVHAAGFCVMGDLNGDGVCTLADIVLLQKYLLAEPDIDRTSWRAADYDSSGALNACDLTLMKRAMLCPRALSESAECAAAGLLCADDGLLLYSENIDAQIAPASLTKLLTATVALRCLDPDTVITVGSEQSLVKPHSSLCLIKPGHRLRLRDLLTGMLVASGNDAAYTVAVAAARAANPCKSLSDAEAAAAFADMMNACAAEIGMTHSHFVSPEGWDDPQQYTTAADLLLLAQHSFSDPVIREITGTLQTKVYFVSGENAVWKNTNSLLDPESKFYCADAIGMKTGTTAAAGRCLIAAFQRGGKTYFTAVTGCRTDSARYLLTLQMLGMLS